MQNINHRLQCWRRIVNYFYNSTLLARFEMITLTRFLAIKTIRFLCLYQKMACCMVVINQVFYPTWMTCKIPHRINPLSNALLLMDQLLLLSWYLWIAQPSKIIPRKSSSHSFYSNFNQVVEELTLFGMFIWKIALKNLQELKEVKVLILVYYQTKKLQSTGMHFFVLIKTKLNYSNFLQLIQVNFKRADWW